MNEYKVSLNDIWDIMNEKLCDGGEVKFSPKGISMLPLIKEGRDSVVLKKRPSKPKKYDVVLYKRANGDFVLHRIIAVRNGVCTMCGDNQISREKNVPLSSVYAIMTGLYHGDEYVSVNDRSYIRQSKQIVRKQCVKYNICRVKFLIRKIFHTKKEA